MVHENDRRLPEARIAGHYDHPSPTRRRIHITVNRFPFRGSIVLMEIIQIMASMVAMISCVVSLVMAKNISHDCKYTIESAYKGDIRSIAVLECERDKEMVWTYIAPGIWCGFIIMLASAMSLHWAYSYRLTKKLKMVFLSSVAIGFSVILAIFEYMALTKEDYFSYNEVLTDGGKIEGQNTYHLRETFYVIHGIIITAGCLSLVMSIGVILVLYFITSTSEMIQERREFGCATPPPTPEASHRNMPPMQEQQHTHPSQEHQHQQPTESVFQNPSYIPSSFNDSPVFSRREESNVNFSAAHSTESLQIQSADFPRPPSFIEAEFVNGKYSTRRHKVSFNAHMKLYST